MPTSAAETTPASAPRGSLQELVERYLDVLCAVEEGDGEITAELAAQLEAIEPQLERKVEAYAAICDMLKLEAESCKRFAEIYTERAKRKGTQQKSLKERLQGAMELIGTKKIKTPTATASIQKNGGAAKLELLVPEALVPDQYFDLVRTLNTKRLADDLQAGKEVVIKDPLGLEPPLPVAQLVRGEHLRFT